MTSSSGRYFFLNGLKTRFQRGIKLPESLIPTLISLDRLLAGLGAAHDPYEFSASRGDRRMEFRPHHRENGRPDGRAFLAVHGHHFLTIDIGLKLAPEGIYGPP